MVAPDEEALVRCETTKGSFTMKFHRLWSPNGYDRAIELYERNFFDGSHFFRAVPNFLVQFGISYTEDKELLHFAEKSIPDDPHVGRPFERGTISFAGSGDNSRTSQMFVSYGSSSSLGEAKWETPMGEVIEGMENVEAFYSYGDMPPWGKGPVQNKIYGHPEYIKENFPLIDKFVHCRVERLNVEKEGEIIYKSDKITDEEAFAKDRELLQVDMKYRPHTKDQPGLPTSFDTASTYGGIAILALMGTAMMLLNTRRKIDGKLN